MNESPLTERILPRLNRGAIRMFRNNVGVAWQGTVKKLGFRKLLIINASAIRFGLCPGSSDLIGWKSITITPEMVGKKVAVFTAVEMKRDEKAIRKEKQINFIEQVNKAGGIGMIIDSEEGVEGLI